MLAVFGDIESFVLRAALVGEVDIHFLQVGRAGSLGIIDLHLHLGNHCQKMADISFHVGFVQRGLGFFLRGKKGEQRQE